MTALLVAGLMSCSTFPMAAQSLADLARQEQDRRKSVKKPSKVLTNKDLKAPPAGAATSTEVDAGSAPPVSETGEKPAAEEKKPEEPGNDQASWSKRWTDLQAEISRNETFAVALQSRINALANEYTNQGDGVRQQAIAVDRQKTIEELNRVKKQITDGKKAAADLQEEARRAGVPAGWLR